MPPFLFKRNSQSVITEIYMKKNSSIITVNFAATVPDFNEINEDALYHAKSILCHWLTDGKVEGEEFIARNPTRLDNNPGSFRFNTHNGAWADFATDDKGSGIISFAQYIFDLDSPVDAAKEVQAALNEIKNKSHSNKPRKSSKSSPTPIVPVPNDAPPCDFTDYELGNPTKIYAYYNSDSELLMYEARWEYVDAGGKKQKKILPISFCDIGNSKSGWRAKAIPKPYPIYNLDFINDKPDATIIICEGSKSAYSAQKLLPSYVCTTPLFGAQSPDNSDWSALKNRVVIVWGDNDEAGRVFAQKVKSLALATGAKSVSILAIPRDFPEKWDAADAYADGWNKRQAIEFVRNNQQEICEQHKGLKIITLDDFLQKKIKPRKMILSPIISEKGAVMIHAYRGIGKTHIALAIAYSVATGSEFLKWNAPTSRKVLLVDGEMPEHTLQTRLRALAKAMGKKLAQSDNFQIIARDFQDEPMPSLNSPEGQGMINKCLNGVDLLILDNLSTLCPDIKENEADSWSAMQGWLLELRSRNIAVLIVHHSGKTGTQRGSSRKEDILDTVITLTRPADYSSKEGARFVVSYEKARGIFGEDAEPFEVELEVVDGKAIWHFMPVIDGVADRIIQLSKNKKSVREIANALNMPSSTVQYRISKLKSEGKL